jgi:hypothetical protein
MLRDEAPVIKLASTSSATILWRLCQEITRLQYDETVA